LPLFVDNEYVNFNLAGAYGAAIVLAILALSVLLAMNLFRRRRSSDEGTPTMGILGTDIGRDAAAEPEGRA